MIGKSELSQEHFDKLLSWLDENRTSAAEKYESIRKRLVKLFVVRGSLESEDLADETIDRITAKIFEITETYKGEPMPYFYGVAQNVFLETLRKPKLDELPISLSQQSADPPNERHEANLACLERCLQAIDAEQRNLILSYYENEKRDKIDNRKQLAKQLEITPKALRIKAFRIRNALEKCVSRCLGNK